MSFAENFRNARKNSGLTQQQVAEVLGLDRSSIAQYERGVSKPCFENIPKICALLNITLDELIK
ncbi:MAG: helix-turn-helix domain-containing protein [Clostridia bacterium]|nr:helix-turn-helix domain-containing protein [Clostridia bacterium]